jgi:hypothetical protein
VPWNFSKFLLDGHTGQVVSYYNPRVSPLSLRKEIESIIKRNTEEHGEYVQKFKYKTKEEIDQEVPDTSVGCGQGGACAKKDAIELENRVWTRKEVRVAEVDIGRILNQSNKSDAIVKNLVPLIMADYLLAM